MKALRACIVAGVSWMSACGPSLPHTDAGTEDGGESTSGDTASVDEDTSDEDTDTGTDTSDTDTSDTDTSDTSTETGAEMDMGGEEPPGEVVELALGGAHSCVRFDDGEIACWGRNNWGQLGQGHVEGLGDDELPCGRVDIGGPAVSVGAGDSHSCALRDDGVVFCWGIGNYGVLGYGNLDNVGNDELPITAGPVDIGEPVSAVFVGPQHNCARTVSDEVVCWGKGGLSRAALGYGDSQEFAIGDSEAPSSAGTVDVGGVVVSMALSDANTCALLEGGAVRCWGRYTAILGQDYGESIGDDEVPTSVEPVDLGGPAVAIAAGGSHVCALLEGGSLRCWGSNWTGQLGLGNTESVGLMQAPAEVDPVDVGEPVVALGLGGTHSCAIGASGALYCWGSDTRGQLGYPEVEEDIGAVLVPANVGGVDLPGVVTLVDAGGYHTCASADGAIHCWGLGNRGQLGYGNVDDLGDDEPAASGGPVEIGCDGCCELDPPAPDVLDGIYDARLRLTLIDALAPPLDFDVGAQLRIQGTDWRAFSCEGCDSTWVIRRANDQTLLALQTSGNTLYPSPGVLASFGLEPEQWFAPLELSAVDTGLCAPTFDECIGDNTRLALEVSHPGETTAWVLDHSRGRAGGGYAISNHLTVDSQWAGCGDSSESRSVAAIRPDCAPDCGPVTVVDACEAPVPLSMLDQVDVLLENDAPLEVAVDGLCTVLSQELTGPSVWLLKLDCTGLP